VFFPSIPNREFGTLQEIWRKELRVLVSAVARSTLRLVAAGMSTSKRRGFAPLAAKGLLKRLEACHEELREMTQLEEDEDSSFVDSLASEMIRPLVLKNKDNMVRLIAGCCLVDLFRIYAPNAPFTNLQQKVIFAFLVDRLRGLQQSQESATYEKSAYILASLARSNSSVLLAYLEDHPADEDTAEDLQTAMMDALFDIMVPSREVQVETQAKQVMVAFLDELEAFSPKILDNLLSRMLPEKAKEIPLAYDLACDVISIMKGKLCEPLCALLNSLLSGVATERFVSPRKRTRSEGAKSKMKKRKTKENSETDSNDSISSRSESESEEEDDEGRKVVHTEQEAFTMELKDHLHDIIFELFKIDPSLLQYTLPMLASQLEVDDLEMRIQAVNLAGKMFCEVTRAAVVDENFKLFSAFLRRIFDINADIRLSLVKFAGFALNVDKRGTSNEEEEEVEGEYREGFWIKHFIQHKFQAKYAKTLKPSSLTKEAEEQPSFLEIAMSDKDLNVKREALEVVVSFVGKAEAMRHLKAHSVGDSLLKKLASNLINKKIDVACNAAEGLAKCFNVGLVEKFWVPSFVDAQEEGKNQRQSPAEKSEAEKYAEEVLQWIPDEVLRHVIPSRNTEDDVLSYRSTVCEFLDNLWLGKRSPRKVETRMRVLLKIWSSLDREGRVGLEKIFVFQRARLRDTLCSVLELRENVWKRGSKGSSAKRSVSDTLGARTEESISTSKEELQGRAKLRKIGRDFVPSARCPNAMEHLEMLWSNKDHFVFRDLRTIVDPKGAPAEIAEAVSDVLQRLGSKSEMSRALRCVFIRLMPTAFTVVDLEVLVGLDFLPSKLSLFADAACTFLTVVRDADSKILQAAAVESDKFKASIAKVIQQLGKKSHDEVALCFGKILCVTATKFELGVATLDALESIVAQFSKLDALKSLTEAWLRSIASFPKKERRLRFMKVFDKIHSALQDLDDEDKEEQLHGPLIVFRTMLKRAPGLCNEEEELHKIMSKVFEKIRSPFSSSLNAKHLANSGRTKVLGVKVLCYEVLRRLQEFNPGDTATLKACLLLLRKLVADLGNPWAEESKRYLATDEIDEASSEGGRSKKSAPEELVIEDASWPPRSEPWYAGLRLAAGVALLKIEARCPRGPAREALKESEESELADEREIQRWVELSWLTLEPNETTREKICDVVYQEFVLRGMMISRFGPFFILAAALKPKGEAFHHLRKTLEYMKKVHLSLKQKGDPAYAGFAPENLLSTLIYLLAHHPQMSTDPEQSRAIISSVPSQRLLIKPIVEFLEALAMLSKQKEINAGLLYAILEGICRRDDILDRSNRNIHMLGEACQLLIKARVKVSPSSLEHPGPVTLPKIYVEPASTPQQQPLSEIGSKNQPSPKLSPVVAEAKRPSLTKSLKSSRQRLGPALPKNFELRVGTGHAGVMMTMADATTARATTPKRGKKRAVKPVDEEEHPATTPTRRQPSRTSKQAALHQMND